MVTSPESPTTFLIGCFRPFLIFARESSSVLMSALRGDVLVVTVTVEVVVTEAGGLPMLRLRFRVDEGVKESSISEAPDGPMDDNEELSLPSSSFCSTVKLASPAAKARIDEVNDDLACRRVKISAFFPMLTVSRAIREVFMRRLHRFNWKT